MRNESGRLLKCHVGEQTYCLDMDRVLAIERGERVAPNPDSSGSFGSISRDGSQFPVYAMSERLGAGPYTNRAGAVLMFGSMFGGRKPWGLAVDRVSRFDRTPSRPLPLPAAADDPRAGYFRGVVVDSGSLILYVAPERLHPNAEPLPVAPEWTPTPAKRQSRARSGPGTGQLLLFSPLNSRNGERSFQFGLSYTQIFEVVSGMEHVVVPSAPRPVLGLIEWRDQAVAIVDAGALLGLERVAQYSRGRLLIARSHAWRVPIAIPVGGEIQSRTLPIEHRPWVQDLSLDLGCTRGVFDIGDGQILVLPDLDQMVRKLTKEKITTERQYQRN